MAFFFSFSNLDLVLQILYLGGFCEQREKL